MVPLIVWSGWPSHCLNDYSAADRCHRSRCFSELLPCPIEVSSTYLHFERTLFTWQLSSMSWLPLRLPSLVIHESFLDSYCPGTLPTPVVGGTRSEIFREIICSRYRIRSFGTSFPLPFHVEYCFGRGINWIRHRAQVLFIKSLGPWMLMTNSYLGAGHTDDHLIWFCLWNSTKVRMLLPLQSLS